MSSNGNILLEYDSISLSFHGNSLLHQVSFQICEKELVLLKGASGTGKSTLLKMAIRFMRQDEGQIRFQGKDIRSISPQELRRQMAYVSQNPYLFPGSIKSNLKAAFDSYPSRTPEDLEAKIQELLKRVGLEYLSLDKPASTVSGGEKARLALIRSWLMNPQLLLLDEPVAGLDPDNADKVMALIAEAVRETNQTAFIISHNVEALMPFSPRLLTLKDRTIREEIH